VLRQHVLHPLSDVRASSTPSDLLLYCTYQYT
jgi:hypothetical protein